MIQSKDLRIFSGPYCEIDQNGSWSRCDKLDISQLSDKAPLVAGERNLHPFCPAGDLKKVLTASFRYRKRALVI
jgi:hypothetical protein